MEWSDPLRPIDDRIAAISAGAVPPLNNTGDVQDDLADDLLSGAGSGDWFFVSEVDQVNEVDAVDRVTPN